MCTVSVVPVAHGVRMVCNRDERHTRPVARPPEWRAAGGRRAIYPIDPQSGGTWIGANDAGLILSILNASGRVSDGRPRRSRGEIIPWLLAQEGLVEALDAARRMNPRAYPPFRLVAIQGTTIGILATNGTTLSVDGATLTSPRLFTSSSLGDAAVEAPRERLFRDLVLDAPDGWVHGQTRFHAHGWPDRPELSVCMRRVDAATVSRSIVLAARGAISFGYEPLNREGRAA
jgi:hypothetical protein